MNVQEIMKTRVETVDADLSLEEAARRMDLSRIRHLVVTRGREVVGIVSDRDVTAFPTERERAGRTVADVMTPAAATAAPGMPVRAAANLLRGRSIGCLPVIEEGRLVGILTISDLLDLVGRGVESPVERKKHWTVKNRTRRRMSASGQL